VGKNGVKNRGEGGRFFPKRQTGTEKGLFLLNSQEDRKGGGTSILKAM